MNFVDLLRTSADLPESAFLRFNLNVGKPGAIHLFVEGHDDASFYVGFIKTRAASSRHFVYDCHNKDGVYETAGLISLSGARETTLFFTDKDFADILGLTYPTYDNFFTTSFYSIENYLVTDEILERVCSELIRFPKGKWDVDFALDAFRIDLQYFHKRILVLISWIIFHKRRGRINSQNIKMPKLFRVIAGGESVCKVRRIRRSVAYLDSACGVVTTPGSWLEIRNISKELLRRTDPKIYVRGKFEAWFFIEFIKELVAVLAIYAAADGGSASMKTSIHEANFIEVLAPRASEPPEVGTFLSINLPP